MQKNIEPRRKPLVWPELVARDVRPFHPGASVIQPRRLSMPDAKVAFIFLWGQLNFQLSRAHN
jgi:hypothetical protein